MARPPTDARTNRTEKRGSGQERRSSGGRANERACKYVYIHICIKKSRKKKEKIRYPDRSCRTLDAGPIRGQGGPNLQDSGIGEKTREGEIGEQCAANEKNATSHVARGREAARKFFLLFFFLTKRGLVRLNGRKKNRSRRGLNGDAEGGRNRTR